MSRFHQRTTTTSPMQLALAVAAMAGAFLSLLRGVAADCECGYSTEIDGQTYVFTDLIESDFAHMANISKNTDWVRQKFNFSAERNRGEFGEMFSLETIYTNPAGGGGNSAAKNSETDDNKERPNGLELTVKANHVDNQVPVAEIDSSRTDLMYGTYRAGIQLTDVPGTCSAFFWYFNDTQEFDMEFLSKDFNTTNSSYPVNLVMQSRAAEEAGYNAAKTQYFQKAYLPFNPTQAVHEYRFDFLPTAVVFYADSKEIARMQNSANASQHAIPTEPGHMVLQHWSNGNALWSGGPPTEDAVTTVAYVKAYFNSSTTQRHADWEKRCNKALTKNDKNENTTSTVCAVPEMTTVGDTATNYFFTDEKDMAKNQTVSGGNASGDRNGSSSRGERMAGMMTWMGWAILMGIVWEVI